MKNLSKNKIIFILFFAILMLFILNNKTFASFNFERKDGSSFTVVKDLPFDLETYPYYILWIADSSSDLYLEYSSIPFGFEGNGNSFFNNAIHYRCFYDINSSFWTAPVECVSSNNKSNMSYQPDTTTYVSNHDVLDLNGNVVFPKAPQEEQVELTLLPVVEQVEMKGILQEILEILPIVMIVVVSYLALRKALSLLFQLLHQS